MTDARVASLMKLFLIFVGLYFFELASFPVSIDEEIAAFRTDPAIWVHQGRWGAYLVERWLLPHPTIPVVPAVIFGLALCLSYLIIHELIRPGEEFRPWDLALFAIYSAYPTWLCIVEFYTNVAAVGIGVLASAASVFLVFRASKGWFAIATGLGALAISTYQSLLGMLLALSCGVIVVRGVNAPDGADWRTAGKIAATIAASLILYVAGDVIFRHFLPGQSAYFDSLLRLDLLETDPWGVLSRSLKAVGGTYGFDRRVFQGSLWGAAAVLIIGAAALARRSPRRGHRSFLMLGCVFAVVFSPFLLLPVSGGYLPTRSFVTAAFAVWLFAYLAVWSDSKWIAWAGRATIVVLVFQIFVLGNRYQATNYFLRMHDLAVAITLEERIQRLPEFDAAKVYTLAVFGSLPFETPYPKPPTTVIGDSFFFHDGGNAARISPYLRLLGWTNLQPAGDAQYPAVIRALEKMPVWPSEGSVRISEDFVLVRFGKTPSISNQQALDRARATAIPGNQVH